jgi:hypothetical protein
VNVSGSPQSLFDPNRLAQLRASVPPQAAPIFDRAIEAVRAGLADTLHTLFLLAAVILVVALVASVFLREVPITDRMTPPADEPPAPEKAEPEREPVTA